MRLIAAFRDGAVFAYTPATVASDADRAAAKLLQREWRAPAFAGLTAGQVAVCDADQRIVNAIVGPDWPRSVHVYFRSDGDPLAAPAG